MMNRRRPRLANSKHHHIMHIMHSKVQFDHRNPWNDSPTIEHNMDLVPCRSYGAEAAADAGDER
jgi:hypothetical protein